MNSQTAHKATALSLAAVLTLAILGSINLLAVSPAPDSLLAAHAAPVALAQAASHAHS